jgi:hypothetical protein
MNDKGLIATAAQVDDVREQRASYIVRMPADDFIRLTVDGQAERDRIFAAVGLFDEARAAEYTLPNLTVRADGQILQHNGRHRSAAAMKSFGSNAVVDVAVFMVNERRVPRCLPFRNCPRILSGQYLPDETYQVHADDSADLSALIFLC